MAKTKDPRSADSCEEAIVEHLKVIEALRSEIPTLLSPIDQVSAQPGAACRLSVYSSDRVGVSIGYLPLWGAPQEQNIGGNVIVSFGNSPDTGEMVERPAVEFLTLEAVRQVFTSRRGLGHGYRAFP